MEHMHQSEFADTAPAHSPTVTIVSDVLLYREGLAASLLRDGRLRIFDLIAGGGALPAIVRRRPDVLLLDGAMPDCLSLARRLRAQAPGLCIVGFGISGGVKRLVDCAESGLAAFVDSSGTVGELVKAVMDALNGELACTPQVSALICQRLAHLSAAGDQGAEALTRRERQIAALIGDGLSNKEIANELCIGASTVKNHVHNILDKLNVRRRSAIVHQLHQFPWMKEEHRAVAR